MRVTLRRRFERGAGLAIELPGKGDRPAYTVLVKVVHVRPADHGLWALGCQFISPLSDDELQQLLDTVEDAVPTTAEPAAATTPPAAETTVEVRNIRDVQFQLIHGDSPLAEIHIQRFCLHQAWPLKPGAIVTLRGSDSRLRPWILKVRVIKCNQCGERWQLQCRLANPPADWEVLRALGQR
jgi:hypothetical protein